MNSKNKKKNMRRKKQNRTVKSHTDSTTGNTKDEKPCTTVQQSKKKHNDLPKQVVLLERKECLGLIEKTAYQLKLENSSNLVALLEGLFSIFNGDLKKRSARLELISSLLSHVKDCNVSEINALKTQLNLVFMPKELKELIVDPSDLVERKYDLILFILFGPYERGCYLNKGRRIKVTVKKPIEMDGFKVIQEAKLLSQLRHENIIKILAFDKVGSRIALEYMELGALRDALEEYNFSREKLLDILKDITSGMIYLSERHYVLRNLSTENVLLDSKGKCKISNFEYCQCVGDSEGFYIDEHTDLDVDLAAPEVRKFAKFSTKSDVWDMGLVAWEVYHVEADHDLYSVLPSTIAMMNWLRIFSATGQLPRPNRFPFLQWTPFKEALLHQDPAARPTFVKIKELIEKFYILTKNFPF